MSVPKPFLLSGFLSMLALSAFVATLAYFISTPPNAAGKVVMLDSPRPMPNVAFSSIDGSPHSLADYQGKWVVLFFGYTSCPDVCPMSLAYANTEWRRLGERKLQTQLVFVSVDPERDTPENLERYVQSFNPDFRGVTAKETALKVLAENLGVFFRKEPTESALGYLMSHSSDYFILDPKGRWVGSFRSLC